MVDAYLPLVGAVIEDNRVQADAFTGTVRRLGRRSLEAELGVELAARANVRLRITYPAPDREPGDVYGKVTGTPSRDGVRPTRIHLTSVEAMDQAILARLVEGARAPGSATVVSNAMGGP